MPLSIEGVAYTPFISDLMWEIFFKLCDVDTQ